MKSTIDDLALFGGRAEFSEPLHVGRPNIPGRERFMEYMGDILDRRWLTNNGPFVSQLEKELAERMGVRHCVAMCNGTVAMEIAARALGLSGEVVVPAFTFVATAHALQWQEITPVFCDVDPATGLIDPAAAERMVTPRTTGLVGVHLWGRACDVEGLSDLARRRGLKLLFDAAHAFGCTHRGRPVGGFGDAEVFSFHATKFFNTFEGGAVSTNDDALAAKIRLMKNFGFSGYDNVIYVGTNGKMPEPCAAMGVANLAGLDAVVETNWRNFDAYRTGLAGLPSVTLLPHDNAELSNRQYVVARVEPSREGLTRDLLVDVLHAENVLVRRYFHPGVHRMEPYRSLFPHAGLLLPNTEALSERVVSFPTGTSVGTDEVARVCALVRFVVERGFEIAARRAGRTGGP